LHTKTLLSVALLLVLSACGDDDATSTTATTGAATTTTAAAATTTSDATTTTGAATTTTEAATTTTVATTGRFLTTIDDDDLGEILVDHDGFTLYLFLPDNQSTPTCNGTCATTWPPFEDDGEVGAGADVDPALLGSVARTDGSLQVTYNGWPLYYYLPDVTPGDTGGQGIGGNWWAIDDGGEPVMD
jgi:predicted lipoprotein with Yx(FWY)xxD motif